MHSSTCLLFIPNQPRGLALLLILSLLLQVSGRVSGFSQPSLPAISFPMGHCQRLRRKRHGTRARRRSHPKYFLVELAPRLVARSFLLTGLLCLSGTSSWTPVSGSVLLIPLAQVILTAWHVHTPAPITQRWPQVIADTLQRLYQLTLVLLGFAVLMRWLVVLHSLPGISFFSFALTTWVTQPDADTEIQITTSQADQYTVTLRGTWRLVWEPRDGFEKWMFLLFLRHLHLPGQVRPCLSQSQVAQAVGSDQTYVGRWERLVAKLGWHALSDRYRHQQRSLLPDAELSQQILQLWVPAFWLSAWDVRERLIQTRGIPNREALSLESLHALAKHTGFNRVRDVLRERFEFQDDHFIAKEHWWLRELVALNERLIAKLEKGERFTPQELVEIEPVRLHTSEKPADSAPPPPPLAAALKSVLFDSPPTSTLESPIVIRCTYCGSDQVAPKSKTPRCKTIVDEDGEKQSLEVVRYYCHNPECQYHTFTHFPPGILPHARYALHMRLVAVEVYETLLTTYRRSARLFGVKAVTVYHWVASLSPAATCLAAYLGVVRTSGVVGIDDKWILVCSPSAVRPHGRRSRAVWRYAYFAIDVYSYDLLALELYPQHNDEAVRLILLELKAKGIRPRVVVSDLDPAYGRILPQVFPNAVHHECIFHALQFWSSQMSKVYGRYYLEKVPAVVPLHEALTNLFKAQTQKTVRKRFADLMAMRETYVAKTPEIAGVFDSVERHFPKLVNAIESSDIPRTNNATELVIRRFDQHYQAMCGLDTLESAQTYLRVFELVYRLTPFSDDARPGLRGKSPLELAGYDLRSLPIANFFTQLKWPTLALESKNVVPIT